MKLNGNFVLDDAMFTSPKVQDKVGELSYRGLGRPDDLKGENSDVRSSMQSNFQMANGAITLPDLKYIVPGAEINLNGTYGIDGGQLNFTGIARMQATVSKMVGGWKGFLLKPADRFFKKDGAGTQIPIEVTGTREDPHFGLNFGGSKHTSPELPGDPK